MSKINADTMAGGSYMSHEAGDNPLYSGDLWKKVYDFAGATAGGTDNFDLTLPSQMRVLDAMVIPDAAAAGSTVQLFHYDGTTANAISNTIAAAVAGTVGRATTIDPTYNTVDPNAATAEYLRVAVVNGAGVTASGKLIVTIQPVEE